MRYLLSLTMLTVLWSCGGGGGGGGDTDAVDATDTPVVDVQSQEVSYPGYDVSPEVKAGARPIAEVEFLPTTGQKPPGDEPDLAPFFKGPDPWCEQKPLGPGQDPGCVSLSKQFNCKYVQNPGPVGAWLSPGVSMLFCATCEPASGDVDCECVSESVSTIPTPLGGTLCLNAIIFE
ncbi:MAG: hypothetical protein GXP54_04925, partial [Deltaproteobacteria bacterium]|nr:hypothetical protein [Deltaproteobacteria bacterium]